MRRSKFKEFAQEYNKVMHVVNTIEEFRIKKHNKFPSADEFWKALEEKVKSVMIKDIEDE